MHHVRQENLPFVERSGERRVASAETEPVIKAVEIHSFRAVGDSPLGGGAERNPYGTYHFRIRQRTPWNPEV